jgi:hypothetical protein
MTGIGNRWAHQSRVTFGWAGIDLSRPICCDLYFLNEFLFDECERASDFNSIQFSSWSSRPQMSSFQFSEISAPGPPGPLGRRTSTEVNLGKFPSPTEIASPRILDEISISWEGRNSMRLDEISISLPPVCERASERASDFSSVQFSSVQFSFDYELN